MNRNTMKSYLKLLVVFIVLLGCIDFIKSNKFKFYENNKEYVNGKSTSILQSDSYSYSDSSRKDNKNETVNNNIENNTIEYKEKSVNTVKDNEQIVYTSYKDDVFADNAREVQGMLRRWNYLREDKKKIAYLTFDDGPSLQVTPKILEILRANNIKATFFVLGSAVEQSDSAKKILKEMVAEGHAIGNHGYSHNYKILYPGRVVDTNAFIDDINRSEKVLETVLGENFSTSVIRMPGGHMSWNTNKLDPILEKNGLSYIDWNSLTGDAEGRTKTTEQLMKRLEDSVSALSGNNDVLVVLMHDSNSKMTTAQSLQNVIDYLKELGYEFRTLK